MMSIRALLKKLWRLLSRKPPVDVDDEPPIPKIAYVNNCEQIALGIPLGNDATAIIDDPYHPFKTIQGAIDAMTDDSPVTIKISPNESHSIANAHIPAMEDMEVVIDD